MITTIKNNKGMSIVTALVGAAIGVIVMSGLATMITDVFKSQRTAQTKDAHREVAMAIRQLLIDPNSCTASFKNKDPRLAGFTATEILDDATPANIKYQTGVPYLNNLVIITGFTMKNFVQDVPTNDKIGKAELDIEMDKIGSIVGSRSIKTTIFIQATLNAGYKITQCNALGSADSLWLISPFDSDDIFYGLGRVGIGNSRPMGQLDVASGMSGAAPNVTANDLIVQSSDDSGISILAPANKVSRLFFGNPIDAGAGRVQYDHTSNLMTVFTSGTEKVRVNSSGNVGIGNINPAYKLDITGSARVSGEIISTNLNQARFIGVKYGVIHRNDGANYYILSTDSDDPYGTWNALRPFNFSLSTGDVGLGSNTLYVRPGGNVGVGTTAPAQKLDVIGGIKVKTGEPTAVNTSAAGLSFDGDTGVFSPVDGKINFWSNNNKTMTVYGANVGIGTDAPTKKLDVVGDGFFSGNFAVGNKAQANAVAATAVPGSIIAAIPTSNFSVALGENALGERGLGIYEGTTQRGSFFERDVAPYGKAVIMKNHWGGHLAFQVTNATNTVVYTPMGIDASKRFVGIGQDLPIPNWQLDVYGDINTNTAYRFQGQVICASINCTGTSDRRLKKDIKPLISPLEKVLKLRGVSYHWKDAKKFGSGEHIGFIAQEVEQVFPQLVSYDKVTDTKSISYQHLIAPLVEAFKVVVTKLTELETSVKELLNLTEDDSRKIASLEKEKVDKVDFDKLKSENEMLKKENEDIKSRLERLEKLLQSK